MSGRYYTNDDEKEENKPLSSYSDYNATREPHIPPQSSQNQHVSSAAGYPSSYAMPGAAATPQNYSVAPGSYQTYSTLAGPAPQASPYPGTVTVDYGNGYQAPDQSTTPSYVVAAGSIGIRQPSESSYAAPTIHSNSAWTRVSELVRETDIMQEYMVDNLSQSDNIYGDAAQHGTGDSEVLLYDPYGPNGDRQPVIELWRDVCDEPIYPGGQPLGSPLEICHRYDHVDFYRLICLTVVFHGSVETREESVLYHIAEILNYLGRPKGYTKTLPMRQPSATGRSNHTTAEIRALFKVLSDTRCKTRDKPFQRVLEWARILPNQPYKVLQGIYEGLRWYSQSLGSVKGVEWQLRWHWYPYAFMYKQAKDGNHDVWYLDNERGPSTPSSFEVALSYPEGPSQQPACRRT
jgi:hypothetical protein